MPHALIDIDVLAQVGRQISAIAEFLEAQEMADTDDPYQKGFNDACEAMLRALELASVDRPEKEMN